MRSLLQIAISNLKSNAKIVIFVDICNFEFEIKREICDFFLKIAISIWKSNAKNEIFAELIAISNLNSFKREKCDL